MSGIATAIAGSAIIGGVVSSRSAGRAADAQQQASEAATAEQARQFDIMQEAQAPYQQVGSAALNQLAALYGLPQYQQQSQTEPMTFQEFLTSQGGISGFSDRGGFLGGFMGDLSGAQSAYQQYLATAKTQPSQAGATAPDYANFFASPDYQFALKQGLDATQNSAASKGSLYSGNALRGITDYGQGMASQQLNTYANRLAGIAGVGQTAANAVGQGALQTGANVGNLLLGQGNARASGIINQGNAWANTANQLGMLYGMGAFGGGSPFGTGGSNAMAMNYNGPLYGGGLA